MHPDALKATAANEQSSAKRIIELEGTVLRYHEALASIAMSVTPYLPAPPGDTFGPKVKLADVQAMRDVAREALKG